MEMSLQSIEQAITGFRAAGQGYNTAQVRCPCCPAIFALVTPVAASVTGNTVQVVAHENAVQAELEAHLSAKHAEEKDVRDPISGDAFPTVAELVSALKAGSRWAKRP